MEGSSLKTLPELMLTANDMSSLSVTEVAEIQQALIALRPDWAVADVRIERFLAGGYSNRNYRVRYDEHRFVLRLPGLNCATDFVAELEILESLQNAFERADSSHPEMRLAETVAAQPARGWLLTRWVEQPVLASVADVSAVQLAEYLAALHQRLQPISRTVNVASAATLIDAIMSDLGVLFPEPLIRRQLRQNLTALTASTSQPQVCHIDLNPWNLLFDGSNCWVTLDWETLNSAPPLFDLVVLCDGYAINQGYGVTQTAELAEQCRVSYNTLMQTQYCASELAALRTLFQWREYAWAAARLRQGTLRDAVLGDVIAQRNDYAIRLAEQADRLDIKLETSEQP